MSTSPKQYMHNSSAYEQRVGSNEAQVPVRGAHFPAHITPSAIYSYFSVVAQNPCVRPLRHVFSTAGVYVRVCVGSRFFNY